MTDLFLKLLDMSISAGWVVLAVLAARLVLRKAPKWVSCALWALVAVRLLCPFSFESAFSLIPNAEPVTQELLSSPLRSEAGNILSVTSYPTQVIDEDASSVESPAEESSPQAAEGYAVIVVDTQTASVNWLEIGSMVWLVGIAVMLSYAAVSYLRIRRKVQASIDVGNGVYLCDYINTPFILGIVKPKIYLPSAMDPGDAAHVLAHEQAHLKRKDHWWKPLGFALLAVHWFNPLLWAAYLLLCRDIELACDEKVVKDMGIPEKKAYSEALLKCSVPRHLILACPLAFGEVGVKQRVKSVLHYEKPGFWVLLVSAVVIVTVAVCFLTNPPEKELAFPFEKDLWATELVYSEKGGSLKDVPDKLLETLNLSRAAASTIATYYWNNFEEVTLTQANFDAYLSESGTWTDMSAQKLRKQTANAWILHDIGSGDYYYTRQNYYDFYYLLQLKNGELYLTSGTYWTAKLKQGQTRISWILRLEDARPAPLVEIDSPFLYTRQLTTDTLSYLNTLAVTAYASDGSQSSYEIDSRFFNLLHSIPEDAFSLGTPVQNVETSIHLDLHGSNFMDITLRYGDEKVDMVFHENAPWDFADTGNRAWIIQFEELNAFFHRYSRNYTLPASLLAPQDAYQWCQDMDMRYIQSKLVGVYSSQAINGCYSLGPVQVQELLSELKKLPSSTFVPSDWNIDGQELYRDGGIIMLNWNYPADIAEEAWYSVELAYFESHLYFTICSQEYNVRKTWEIRDEAFAAYQAAFYELTIPHARTTEYPTGTLSVSHGYASITMDTYDFLEYEVVDYVDDETPFGIRYRPKDVDEGWVILAFYPGGYTPDPSWESNGKGYYGNKMTFFDYSTLLDGSYYRRARHFTNLAGDYVVLNEGADLWLDEYSYEMEYPSDWGNIDIAADYLTEDAIKDIARPMLQNTLNERITVSLNGVERTVVPTFDYLTGIWTLATEGSEDHEPVIVMQLDVYGNIISPE